MPPQLIRHASNNVDTRTFYQTGSNNTNDFFVSSSQSYRMSNNVGENKFDIRSQEICIEKRESHNNKL